jgi:hypothetical protein
MSADSFMTIILSVLMIIFGVGIIIKPIWYDAFRSHYFDLTGSNYILGPACVCCFGILFLWRDVRKRKKERNQNNTTE